MDSAGALNASSEKESSVDIVTAVDESSFRPRSQNLG
jgi:hypothetical protein